MNEKVFFLLDMITKTEQDKKCWGKKMLKILLGYIKVHFSNSSFSNFFNFLFAHFIFISCISLYQKDFEDQSVLIFKRRIMLHLFLKSSFLCLLFLEVDGNKYGEFDIKDLETSQVFIYYRWITLGTIHILSKHYF